MEFLPLLDHGGIRYDETGVQNDETGLERPKVFCFCKYDGVSSIKLIGEAWDWAREIMNILLLQ